MGSTEYKKLLKFEFFEKILYFLFNIAILDEDRNKLNEKDFIFKYLVNMCMFSQTNYLETLVFLENKNTQ